MKESVEIFAVLLRNRADIKTESSLNRKLFGAVVILHEHRSLFLTRQRL